MKATAKRRRSKKQIQEDKERKEWEEAETARKIARLDQLEQENAALKNEIQGVEEVKREVQGFMDAGLIVQAADGRAQLNSEAILQSEMRPQESD